VSSDACRALISDDEADQSATKDAFKLLNEILAMRLHRGRLTVVDATSVQAWARAPLLAMAREAQRPVIAIVFDLPREIVAEQNQSRARTVGSAVIEQQSADLRATLDELPREGLEGIHVFRTQAEADSAEIRLIN
jgi:predicted kinase